MTAERSPQGERNGSILRVGQVDLAVQGLHAESAVGRDGSIEIKSNLTDPDIQKSIGGILQQPRYQGLVDGIRSGEKMAFAVFKKHMTLSLIVISVGTTAVAAAYEFGIRHGRDVREIIDFFKPKEEPPKS